MTSPVDRPPLQPAGLWLRLWLGSGAYGFAVGAWHAPRLGLYAACKMPLLLVATAMVTALANWLFARGLGAELQLRDSIGSVLQCFATLVLVLAGLAPIFVVFDLTLPPSDASSATTVHHGLGLAHVVAIASAGVIAVRRQAATLHRQVGERLAPRITRLWLALNLLVGAQLSWNLRPWFGSPGAPVQWLRDDPFDGTFYESVFRMLVYMLFG